MIIACMATICLLASLPVLHPAKAIWPHLNMSLIWGVVIPSPAKSLATSLMVTLLGQHCRISWNGCHAGSTRIQGQVRWDWWGDCDWIQSGTIRGWLVEIGASHQIWWNILREHNWGVPSAPIKFIYYVTYILEYLIMLWGCAHTDVYKIL